VVNFKKILKLFSYSVYYLIATSKQCVVLLSFLRDIDLGWCHFIKPEELTDPIKSSIQPFSSHETMNKGELKEAFEGT